MVSPAGAAVIEGSVGWMSQIDTFRWLVIDAGHPLESQLGSLANVPTHGLYTWPGLLTEF